MNYPKTAKSLLTLLGGKENIEALAHCATRLRLAIKDESLINEKDIENLDGVKGQFKVAGQYQIIFGSGIVNQVYAEMPKPQAWQKCQQKMWLLQEHKNRTLLSN